MENYDDKTIIQSQNSCENNQIDNDSSSLDQEIQDIFDKKNNLYTFNEDNSQNYITNCLCYSLPMFYNYDKYKKLENSDKILIPMHIINNIKNKFEDIQFPLIFTIEKIDNEGLNLLEELGMKKTIKCQAYEFLEDIDDIYIPFRLMQNLWMNEATLVTLKYSLNEYPKGEKIILRPHTSDFLEIDDPKIFLEKGLIENYSVLSKQDIIAITYFDHTLYFDVLETFPEDTIIVNNTDLEVDFKKPLDFKDPPSPEKILQPIIEKKVQQLTQNNNTNIKHENFIAFSGTGNRLGNK